MKTLFAPIIKNGGFDFGSDYNSARFRQYLKDNDGKRVKIEAYDNPVSDQMRGYMFGAVIPFLRMITPKSFEGLTDEQVYELLKKNFNYFEAYNPVTKRKERFGQSVMNTSCKNSKAMEFIARIADWVYENYQQTLPDSEEYNRSIKNAGLTHEEYETVISKSKGKTT
jgi:hypothetical protein